MKSPSNEYMLNLRDRKSLERNKPLLIAHRGGVVSPDSPENSMGAIRLASVHGYEMVELDIIEPKDHVPMLFHSYGTSGNLFVDCGIDRYIAELTSDELSRVTYRQSTQTIAKLSDALELCAGLNLGVMLDIEASAPSDEFLKYISESLIKNKLTSSSVTLSTSRRVAKELEGLVIFPIREGEYRRVLAGEAVDLRERYHFDWGSRINEETIRLVHQNGAFVIAAINYFHYPRHAKEALAAQDIERLLKAGVDGFQIDDEFRELVPEKG